LSWWESSKLLVFVGTAGLAISALLGVLSWQLIVFVTISVNANHVHKLSHRTRQENGPIIGKLQDWKILLTPHQHGLHHTDPKNTDYCPVTNLVNPLLERIKFWDHLVVVIERLTGIIHRHDTAVRGNGPGSAWLEAYRPARRIKSAPACDCQTCPKTADVAKCPRRRAPRRRRARLTLH